MPDMYWSGRPSASVQNEFYAFLVKVKDCVEPSVAEEYASLNLKVKFVGVFCHSFQEVFCQGLGSELADKPFVINFSFDFPRSDYHFVVF